MYLEVLIMITHKEKCKLWYENNKEERKLSKKVYYEAHKEHIIEKQLKWQKDNEVRLKQYRRQRYIDNREHIIKMNTAFANKKRKKHKEQLVKYKGGKCSVCGYNKYNGALEFHHLDPSKKNFNIGHHLTGTIEKLRKEADKCILLCANCHKELHGGD